MTTQSPRVAALVVGATVKIAGTRRKRGKGNAIGVITAVHDHGALVVKAEIDGTPGLAEVWTHTRSVKIVEG